MALFKKILVPLDVSQSVRPLTACVLELAKTLGAEVVAVYVAPTMNRYGLFVPWTQIKDFVDQVNDGAKATLDKCVKEDFAGILARGEVVHGYAPDAILELADKEKADLIVIGCHGHSSFEYELFGSVAEKVIKGARVPVMTVPLAAS